MELAGAHRLQHALVEHQGGYVGVRNDRPLLAGQAARFTKAEEAFDLLVDPADRLHLTKLVDRAGDGEALFQRRARQGRDQRANLTQGSAVAVHIPVGLLQGDTRGDIQRVLLGITAAQVAGENHHALGVDRLTEIDLTLDVDDARTTRIHRGRNPRRHAKRRIADFQHGQAVALADLGTAGVDENDAGQHVIQNPRRDPPGTHGLGLERAFDMADIGAGLARLLTDKVRLADQLEEIANPRRQTPLMLGQARTVGCHSRHGGRRQRRHALFRGAGFHQLRELLQAVFDQGNVLVEIHQHAEHFLKVRIEVLQGVVQLARADDDDLHLQRDHLWRQGYGGNAAQLAERRLHLQLARMQGTLERIPDKRLAQQFLRLQHQKAAVGTVHRTRTQLSVTGVKRALIGVVFNTTEQVVVSRVRLEHHRRATAMVMAHYQAGAVLLLQQLTGLRVGLVHIHQLLDHGLQQVDLHRLQVGADPGIFCVTLGQRRQQRLQRQADGFFIELTQLVARLALPLRQARQLFVEALFQGRDIDVKTFALSLRQLGELGLVQRLAVLHRGEGDVAAVAVQGHLFFQRGALDHIQGAVVALVEDAVDGALLLLVRRMLEHRRKGRQQVINQVVDIGQKGTRRARRQLQRPRLARFVEVIDVHPVRRCGQTLGFGLEVALHKRETPGAGLAHHIDVVTRPRHGHAKLQGIHRPLLAEHAAKGLQLVSTVEVELGGIKRTGQRFGRHPQGSRYRVGHG